MARHSSAHLPTPRPAWEEGRRGGEKRRSLRGGGEKESAWPHPDLEALPATHLRHGQHLVGPADAQEEVHWQAGAGAEGLVREVSGGILFGGAASVRGSHRPLRGGISGARQRSRAEALHRRPAEDQPPPPPPPPQAAWRRRRPGRPSMGCCCRRRVAAAKRLPGGMEGVSQDRDVRRPPAGPPPPA